MLNAEQFFGSQVVLLVADFNDLSEFFVTIRSITWRRRLRSQLTLEPPFSIPALIKTHLKENANGNARPLTQPGLSSRVSFGRDGVVFEPPIGACPSGDTE